MSKTIKVNDIYLRAYLAAKGEFEESVKVESVNGRKTVVFVYEETKEVEEIVTEFRDDDFMRLFIKEYLLSKKAITRALYNR